MTDATAPSLPEEMPETPPPADPLSALQASARDAWSETLRLSRAGCDQLIATADTLAQARALCPPDVWGKWVQAAGIPVMGVARLLEVHRVALDTPALERLGGIVLAVTWAAEAILPCEGEVLAVTVGEWQPDRAVPVAYVWPAGEAPGAFCVARANLSLPSLADRFTRAPIAQERDVWATVWHLLGPCQADVMFRPIRREAGRLVEQLEAGRRAALEGDTRVVH